MGHSAAWLLAARRTVEARKEASDFLELAFPSPGNNSPGTASDIAPQADAELILYESAVGLIQTYLQLGNATMAQAPEFYQNCIAYALLVLSKYDLRSRQVTETEVGRLLTALREFYNTSVRKSAAVEFGLDRALARLGCE